MVDRQSFASLAWSRKGKVTRRESFLAGMDAPIPWADLIAPIEPHHPKGEDAIYDSESMRRFAKVELSFERAPDETTILRFRHLLEKHRLTAKIFEALRAT
jgi:hypothetical protein